MKISRNGLLALISEKDYRKLLDAILVKLSSYRLHEIRTSSDIEYMLKEALSDNSSAKDALSDILNGKIPSMILESLDLDKLGKAIIESAELYTEHVSVSSNYSMSEDLVINSYLYPNTAVKIYATDYDSSYSYDSYDEEELEYHYKFVRKVVKYEDD